MNDAIIGNHISNLANNPENDKSNGLTDAIPAQNEGNGQDMQVQSQQNYDGSQMDKNVADWSNMGGYNSMIQSQNGMPNANWNWMPNMMGKPNTYIIKTFPCAYIVKA